MRPLLVYGSVPVQVYISPDEPRDRYVRQLPSVSETSLQGGSLTRASRHEPNHLRGHTPCQGHKSIAKVFMVSYVDAKSNRICKGSKMSSYTYRFFLLECMEKLWADRSSFFEFSYQFIFKI